MTGTIPKNAGSTSPGAPKKARALCGDPRRSFHFSGPQRVPLGEPGCQGRSPGSTKLSQDRTETRIKLKVARGLVARYEPGCAGLGRAGIGWAGLGSAGPARAPFEPGTQNSSFLFSGILELRAACIYNQSQLGFFPGGLDGEPGAR